MKTYIVRLKSTSLYIGIYHAATPEDLSTIVNQTHCPSDCSFADVSEKSHNAIAILDRLGLGIEIQNLLSCPVLIWSDLDPDADHFGSLLDNLLATSTGRTKLGEILSAGGAFSRQDPRSS